MTPDPRQLADHHPDPRRTQDPDLVDAQDESVRHTDRLRRALGWLAVLAEPGRSTRPVPALLTDEQLERRAEQEHLEAAELAELGMIRMALGPSPAPLVLAAVDGQIRAGRAVAGLVARVGRAGPYRPPVVRPEVPGDVLAGLTWLAGGDPAWAADAAGVIVRQGVLLEVADHHLVVDVAGRLREAADAARQAAGIDAELVVPYPGGRCPACRGRALEWDRTLPQPRWWVVRCISTACRCAGPGCPCGQRIRYEGRAHAWSHGEFEQLQQTIERRPRTRVRSGRSGRGGPWM